MLKTLFVLYVSLAFLLTLPISAQLPENVTFKVTVVDSDLNLKNVPKFSLVIRKPGEPGFSEMRITTSSDGQAVLSLPAGNYVVVAERPLIFQTRSFGWEVPFAIEIGKPVIVELSSNNATVSPAGSSAPSARDISRGGEMFTTLRNGVVTVQGELEPGTGFIIDEAGLVLTNQHVIDQSNEIRIRFDKHTAVKARVIAVDKERDLAILQVNLAAFPNSRILPLAMQGSVERPVIEGERVFTIGSPLYQDKVLSSGVVSKIEKQAITTDITFNPSNAGAPLFNSLGQVVGINTFKIKDRSGSAFAGNETMVEESGLSGIVAIDEAAPLIEKARVLAAAKRLPPIELMPNLPEGVFPIETIKTALQDRNFPLKQYVSDVKNYQIKYMTPVYKFYVMEKDRIESLKNRRDRNKEKGLVDAADPFRDLRYWSEYAGELRPVVQILALPETGATGASMALSVLAQGVVGYGTPLSHKYKADFYQMKLMCDGKEIVPLIRNKTEIVRELQNYYKDRKHYTYAGVYSYPYDAFAPGHCRQMQVQVFSEEDLETPITSDVTEATRNRIWSDFQDFRNKVRVANVPQMK
ncbi:MAG TPA: serine protease [Pyrinomonadaceae bacterium]